jgi:hypothetical protein
LWLLRPANRGLQPLLMSQNGLATGSKTAQFAFKAPVFEGKNSL